MIPLPAVSWCYIQHLKHCFSHIDLSLSWCKSFKVPWNTSLLYSRLTNSKFEPSTFLFLILWTDWHAKATVIGWFIWLWLIDLHSCYSMVWSVSLAMTDWFSVFTKLLLPDVIYLLCCGWLICFYIAVIDWCKVFALILLADMMCLHSCEWLM